MNHHVLTSSACARARTLASFLLLTLSSGVACTPADGSPGQPSGLGAQAELARTFPTMPSGVVEDYAYFTVGESGRVIERAEYPISITGAGAHRTIACNARGYALVAKLNADATQPAEDVAVSPFRPLLAAHPSEGVAFATGAHWTVSVPSALAQILRDEAATGVFAARPEYTGTVTGVTTLANGWQVARVNLTENLWVASRVTDAGSPSLESSDSYSVGVGDIASNGEVAVVLRVTYFRPADASTLPSATTASDFEHGIHLDETYCLRPAPWLPAELTSSVPTIEGAPAPAELARCTTL